MISDGSIPIVLTGTIIPNGISGVCITCDPAQRRAEYLENIGFYRKIAPVYFLENSSYPIETDPDFQESPDFFVRRLPHSDAPQRGKGYQEFEMMDRWLQAERNPPSRWLKISGRYRVRNTDALLSTYALRRPTGMIIDQSIRSSFARTFVFLVTTDYYQRHVRGLYEHCDDDKGDWIERVLYRALRDDPARDYEFFGTQPDVTAIQGSTGAKIGYTPISLLVRHMFRRANRLFDRRYLRYVR